MSERPDSSIAAGASALEDIARPLLRLVRHISGMETSFVTAIDWDAQKQDVLFSLNTGAMQIPEGSTVDWSDSMCRSMFLSGMAHSSAVGLEVPATAAAAALAMQSFFAVPILIGDSPIGTVCGASRDQVVLTDDQVEAMGLIAEALQQVLTSDRAKLLAETRAQRSAQDAADARAEIAGHAQNYRQMEQLAHTDALTGLPNRRAFTARWEDELARSGRRHFSIGLMLLDADQFKNVNDSRGHLVGDSVLQAIAATLAGVARTPDIVARLGGDEFAFVVSHSAHGQLLELAENIRQRFAAAAAALGVRTTLSIGIVSSEDCPRQMMLRFADQALYRSKLAGGDQATLFSCPPGVETAAPPRSGPEDDLLAVDADAAPRRS